MKCKGSYKEKTRLHAIFKQTRKQFDKLLRKKERKYNNTHIESLETMCVDNQKTTKKPLKKLSSNKTSIPMSVYENDILTKFNEKHKVLSKWKT